MTTRDFCFWLQGYLEISGEKTIYKCQVSTIEKHLNLVLRPEINPDMGALKHQDELNNSDKKDSVLA